MMDLTKDQLRQLAAEAYGRGVSAQSDEERGYSAGVEDLARFLSTGQATGRLDRLVSWASAKIWMPF